ncbi:zinc finger, GRF-type [Artemisia annua]|uniref:Zinc finger, GRF-type n=1 Tax=Artemisia annua TaxID=35608 RepID=A0A2U1M9R2_ARTAN|nr:zinc finger, GRF-type [Artemisia annua]
MSFPVATYFLVVVNCPVRCWCGKQAITRTSWTSANPGRRFYCCPDEGSSCRWIGRYDPELCARSRMIIPGLLRGRNELEERLEVAIGDVWKWKIYLVLSWILVLIVYALG